MSISLFVVKGAIAEFELTRLIFLVFFVVADAYNFLGIFQWSETNEHFWQWGITDNKILFFKNLEHNIS